MIKETEKAAGTRSRLIAHFPQRIVFSCSRIEARTAERRPHEACLWEALADGSGMTNLLCAPLGTLGRRPSLDPLPAASSLRWPF
jgi:hypothetical protein